MSVSHSVDTYLSAGEKFTRNDSVWREESSRVHTINQAVRFLLAEHLGCLVPGGQKCFILPEASWEHNRYSDS